MPEIWEIVYLLRCTVGMSFTASNGVIVKMSPDERTITISSTYDVKLTDPMIEEALTELRH